MCASCPVCSLSFSLPELERHVNDHFEDNEISRDVELAQATELDPLSPLSKQCESSLDEGFSGTWLPYAENNSEGQTSKHSEEKVKCLVSLQLKGKFYHVEDGLVTLLRICLELDSKNLCSIISRHVDHFQSTKSEDSGWGCGWRNIQMMSSHLITESKDAREVLFGGAGFVPEIASLQHWLEIAWERGFDTVGARSFQSRIYGSSKWIGTTECALLRSFGLRARIVDFEYGKVNGRGKKSFMKQVHGPMDKFVRKLHSTTSQTNGSEHSGAEHSESHIRPPYCFQEESSISDTRGSFNSTGDHHALVDWVWNYFASENSYSSGRVSVSKKISLKRNAGWQRLLKRGVHTLKKPQYQLCYVDPGIAFGKELEQLKAIDSILVEI